MTDIEKKLGFKEIRTLLSEHCLSALGRDKVEQMTFLSDPQVIRELHQQVADYRRVMAERSPLPEQHFHDLRAAIQRIRLEGTQLEEHECWELYKCLTTVHDWVSLVRTEEEDCCYPSLARLAEGVFTFHNVTRRIEQIFDKYGHIKDEASADLSAIRRKLRQSEGSVSRALHSILRAAKAEGLVESDVSPTLRDGRLVIPVSPALKRRIKGIVHDESASGKTVFIEPAEVVEANNLIRELEADEKRELLRILREFTELLRPNIPELQRAFVFLADIEFLRAKTHFADRIHGVSPQVQDAPALDWTLAQHPLLALKLAAQGKKVVPMDITLTRKQRILVISGPNAGGKSVCLKTVGLLQYMLQCGLPAPMGENSKTGVFQRIFIDIGDDQSIDDDLSTYSSHLLNMKNMMRGCSPSTLLLVDEFGGGTEPTIGGAIAEAILRRFVQRGTFGVITTHYQNLKQFADNTPGLVNGAMLYDRQRMEALFQLQIGHPGSSFAVEIAGLVNGAMLYDRQRMEALFQLQIGHPGSSFAVEIARKIGIPEEIIADATELVGKEYVNADKYLLDITRDKRYWEGKRQTIHSQEKQMESTIQRYEQEIAELQAKRKEIIRDAKNRADQILQESNALIENTIREIREAQAEKERTREARQQLMDYRQQLADEQSEHDEQFEKKMRQIEERRKRHADRQKQQTKQKETQKQEQVKHKEEEKQNNRPLSVGDAVRLKGQQTIGRIESIEGKNARVTFGLMRTVVALQKLVHAHDAPEQKQTVSVVSRQTQNEIRDKHLNFHQDIDVRGMRGDDALSAVTYFIDDAILVGASKVRILHGTGNGILRQLIRQYLQTVPSVKSARDEHVQFGGAGITVVDL
ncbi:MAG: Smr/MutS family protein [Bacteroidaceae bacterium]|nr:Smr/MutS family protein [Bacteroidaceae bacterium]